MIINNHIFFTTKIVLKYRILNEIWNNNKKKCKESRTDTLHRIFSSSRALSLFSLFLFHLLFKTNSLGFMASSSSITQLILSSIVFIAFLHHIWIIDEFHRKPTHEVLKRAAYCTPEIIAPLSPHFCFENATKTCKKC